MIAREGLVFIFSGCVLTVLLILLSAALDNPWLFGLSLVAGLLTLFVVYFFRDPKRDFAWEENVIVAPADGKIVGIDRIPNHPFIEGDGIKISIFLSVFDVHINRVPADGVIDYVKYIPGKFFAANLDKASDKNEHTEIGMTTTGGNKIMFKQIAGLIARRIVCRLSQGDKVLAGSRFGLIRFGSRTELFLPVESRLLVKVGDRVKGTRTIMGYLPEKNTVNGNEQRTGQKNVEL